MSTQNIEHSDSVPKSFDFEGCAFRNIPRIITNFKFLVELVIVKTRQIKRSIICQRIKFNTY